MVRPEHEIRRRLDHTRKEAERAFRLSRTEWLPREDRVACLTLFENLTREVHLLSWVLGARATCEPYVTGWEKDGRSRGRRDKRPPTDQRSA